MESIKFKIRCSAISQIMTNPKTKKAKEAGELSQTAKTYCENWLKEYLFKRRKEFSNKYTEKGTNVEEISIEFLIKNNILGTFDSKNEKHFSNDFLTGTPDIICQEEIIDLKNSWDLFTFPMFEQENSNKGYEWQLQGYMELCEKKSARLIYVLSNTPENLIENEIFYKTKDFEFLTKEQHEEIEKKIRKNFIFDDIDSKLRYKIYYFDYNSEMIKHVKERVLQCETYINNLFNNLKKITNEN